MPGSDEDGVQGDKRWRDAHGGWPRWSLMLRCYRCHCDGSSGYSAVMNADVLVRSASTVAGSLICADGRVLPVSNDWSTSRLADKALRASIAPGNARPR